MSDKPGVVKAALVILWIQIGLLVIGGCAMFALSGEVDKQLGQQAATIVKFTAGFYMVYAIVLAIVTANLGGGRNWARITVIVLNLLGIVTSLFTMSNAANPAFTVIGIGLAAVIIACLAGSQAKEWCLEHSR